MRVIGLTGSIACGKSGISLALARLGAVIVDGDLLARELTAPGGAALVPLRQNFGEGVFADDGTLDRKALARVVFGNAEALQRLDGVMQSLIQELMLKRMEEARQAGAKICVLDMPLLYEKGLDELCDCVWCAWIPEETQLERLMARDGLSVQDAQARIRSQMSADEKASRADIVIDTSGSVEETQQKIPALYAR